MTEQIQAPKDPPPARIDVGALLRQTRIRRGQSVEVVQQQTRIPKKMIEALETNRFEDFPAVVYLRGFFKSYCDHLDLDFDPLWREIDPARPKARPEQAHGAPTAAESPAPVQAAEIPAGTGDGRKIPPPLPPAGVSPAGATLPSGGLRPESSENPFLPLGLFAALLLAGAIFWLLRRDRPAPPPPPPPPPAIAPINQPKEMTLKVVARRETWFQLYADGDLYFQGRVPAGYAVEKKAMESYALSAPEPSALSLSLDGKLLPLSDSMKEPSSGDYKIPRP